MQHLNILKSNLVKLVFVSLFSLVCLVDCFDKDKKEEEKKIDCSVSKNDKKLIIKLTDPKSPEGIKAEVLKINDKDCSVLTLKKGEKKNDAEVKEAKEGGVIIEYSAPITKYEVKLKKEKRESDLLKS